jgi:hypothetical protein
MERYASLVGKRVEAHYRAGDIHLSTTGTLVSDTGKAICLEERFSQNGREKTMRHDIPYEYILRVEDALPQPAVAVPEPVPFELPQKRR